MKNRVFDYRELDAVIHSRPRLAIFTALVGVEEADFNYLKRHIGLTDGTLSVHLRRLEDAGYIAINKAFVNRKPRTSCSLTLRGRDAFEAYIEQLGNLVRGVPKKPAPTKAHAIREARRSSYVPRVRPAVAGSGG